jgi:hypothetical protein
MAITYWQVGSGAKQRDLTDLFLEFGVYAINVIDVEDELKQMAQDDIIILKKGIDTIKAIGVVVDNLIHMPKFFDADGWGFIQYKFVKWYKPTTDLVLNDAPFAQAMLRRTHYHALASITTNAIATWQQVPILYNIQSIVNPLTIPQITQHLINAKWNNTDITNWLTNLSAIQKSAIYYVHNFWHNISEDQIRAFLVVPMLSSLGWTPENIIIEYPVGDAKKADIVCFEPTSIAANNTPKILIEVKKLSEGLVNAVGQAFNYAEKMGGVKFVCVTNGLCYRIYDVTTKKPLAYLNILQFLDKNLGDPTILAGTKVIELLKR